MGKYMARRLLNYLVLLFVAVSLAYVLASLSLHPRQLYQMRNPPLNPNAVDAILYNANVNDKTPILVRYSRWLKGVVLHWDWGSAPGGGAVNEQVSRRIWVSLRLMLPGWIIGTVLGISIGAWTATRQYKVSDRVITLLTMFLIAIPSFVMGTVVQMLAIRFNNSVGRMIFFVAEEQSTPPPDGFIGLTIDRAWHLILPTLVLSLIGFSALSRIQRNIMLDSLGADYVRTARAKGLRRGSAVIRHALRTALIPTGTYLAFQVTSLFLGEMTPEQVCDSIDERRATMAKAQGDTAWQ